MLDNWFRAQRRIHDLAQVLRRRGRPLPDVASLYHGIDAEIDLMAAEFAAWFTARHGGAPHADAAEAIAGQWIEGALPEWVRWLGERSGQPAPFVERAVAAALSRP